MEPEREGNRNSCGWKSRKQKERKETAREKVRTRLPSCYRNTKSFFFN